MSQKDENSQINENEQSQEIEEEEEEEDEAENDEILQVSMDTQPKKLEVEFDNPIDTEKERKMNAEIENKYYQAIFQPKSAAGLRLVADFQALKSIKPNESFFTAALIKNDLFNWIVHLFCKDDRLNFYKDMEEYKRKTGRDYIELQVSFPPDYSTSPPFVRVIQPRFQLRSGHITIGGAVCSPVLTLEEWNPNFDILSLMSLLYINCIDGDPKLDFNNMSPYTFEEAKQSYIKITSEHNWRISGWFPENNKKASHK